MFHRYSTFLIAIAVLIGCSEPQPTGADRAQQPIMPLEVGNRWIGHTLFYDSLGNNTVIIKDTVEIVATTLVNGETWYVTRDSVRMISRGDGLWMADSANPAGRHVAKHPASVGELFDTRQRVIVSSDSLGADTLTESRQVIAVGYSMVVTDRLLLVTGSRIYRQTLDGRELMPTDEHWIADESYYAPSIGRVREYTFTRTSTGVVKASMWELLEVRVR
jgi:hypothetical protein